MEFDTPIGVLKTSLSKNNKLIKMTSNLFHIIS